MNIIEYLRLNKGGFEVAPHQEVSDASHLAQTLQVPGKCVAKCILSSADHGFRSLVAILPSTHQIDLHKLSRCLGGCQVEIVREDRLADCCPDCEIGVVPPFGSQYGMGTIVDQAVAPQPSIIFEGNSHHEAIRLKYEDFQRIECPLTGDFAIPMDGPETRRYRAPASASVTG